MSSDALVWAKGYQAGSSAKKAILLILADYADEAWSCFPSQATIAAQAEVGERTVRRVLGEWERSGLIVRHRRPSRDGRGRSSDRIILQPATVAGRSSVQPAIDDNQPATMTGRKAVQPATDDVQPAIEVVSTGQALAREPQEEPQEEPKPSPTVSSDEAFAAFWAVYPRKVGKGQARRAWRWATEGKTGPRASPDVLLRSVTAFAAAVNGTETKFIPHASTWLNGERWDDAPPETERAREVNFGVNL